MFHSYQVLIIEGGSSDNTVQLFKYVYYLYQYQLRISTTILLYTCICVYSDWVKRSPHISAHLVLTPPAPATEGGLGPFRSVIIYYDMLLCLYTVLHTSMVLNKCYLRASCYTHYIILYVCAFTIFI